MKKMKYYLYVIIIFQILSLCCEIINILIEKYNSIKEEKEEIVRLLNVISKYNFEYDFIINIF